MKKVVIDCFPEAARNYRQGFALVAVDVIRASTSIVTAVAMGRRCFPVPSVEAAQAVSARLHDALLAGELGGEVPQGFEMTNSPAELAMRTDISRPLVLLSSSGTRLIHEARAADAVYIGCLRNVKSLSRYLATRHPLVAVIGAGSRHEFREEDQMCCAWLARELLALGFSAENWETLTCVNRWKAEPLDAILAGTSAAYLRRSGQVEDLEFVYSHINDLQSTFRVHDDEVFALPQDHQDLPVGSSVPLAVGLASEALC